MGSTVIVEGKAFSFVDKPVLKDWDAAFSYSDRGEGWIETYKRKPNNRYTQTSGSLLRIVDEDIPFTQSGGFYVKVRPNYRVGIGVRITNKNNYWEKGFKRTPDIGRFNTSYGSSLALPQSDAYIVLESGDSLSIDIDGDYSDIAQFRVRQGGSIIFDGAATNRNINLTIRDVQKIEPYPSDVQGPVEEIGGDLDGDGVPDDLDYDPNNPFIQTVEDVPILTDEELEDEVAIIKEDDRGGYELVVTSKLQPDPYPLLGYVIVGGFFITILRRFS